MSPAAPIHVAITRRVRAGREAEFEQALHEFFQASFAHRGVHGVTMLAPLPGSGSRDYGILRTFADEAERAAFYASPGFAQWDERASHLTEGEPAHRQLHGLEAWFRGATPPPRWKMAVLTFVGVYVLTLALTLVFSPQLAGLPLPFRNAIFNLIVVPLLTWVVMPFLARLSRRWLSAA